MERNNTFVPTEKEIDALIAGTSKKVSITIQALKETGYRIGELWNCKWTDLDEEKLTLKCIAEKHGKPRETKISAKFSQDSTAYQKPINTYLAKQTPTVSDGLLTSRKQDLHRNSKTQDSNKYTFTHYGTTMQQESSTKPKA